MRTRAERRHNDWTKAIRKKKITESYSCFSPEYPWYDNLHQFSKNKIHCSCPLCRCKTNDRDTAFGTRVHWPMHDIRQLEDMSEQIDEYEDE